MIYSCFNDRTALYRYFETPEQVAVNADLPAPELPEPTGRVGVPSILAGRQLPPGARPIGSGWQARGVVVRCSSGLGSFGSEGLGGGGWLLVGAAALAAAGYYAWRRM